MEQNRRSRILLGQDNNALTWLIIINVVFFVLLKFIQVIYFLSEIPQELFYTQVLNWFTLPADPAKLVTRPWTLLTYMFTHESVWHLIRSVLWLWGFGYIMQDLAGNKKLIPVYLYGGLAGGIFFVLAANLLPSLRAHIELLEPCLGAGAAIMAVTIATTALAPGYRIFPMINGGIPLWILTVVFAGISFAALSGLYNMAANATALIAGAAAGYFFIRQLRKGKDWGEWMEKCWNWFDNLFNPEKKHRKMPSSQQHFYKTTRKPFEKTPHFTQQKLDEILDKINQKGYSFLSDEEKDFLKKASREEF